MREVQVQFQPFRLELRVWQVALRSVCSGRSFSPLFSAVMFIDFAEYRSGDIAAGAAIHI